MLRHFDLASYPPDSADSLHLQIEAMKIALADTWKHVSDPATMRVTPSQLLDDAYLAERAKLIDPKRAQFPGPGVPHQGGTVYLTAADEKGMMLSFIQSNYMGFGSGIVVPGTGISMQNRGAGFTLKPGHPNQVGPRKRPFNTIIPGFLTRNGQPVMAFGVMGGNMQAQGHVQMVTRLVDYNQNPQACSDAPRWIVNRLHREPRGEGFRRGARRAATRPTPVPPDRPQFGFGGAADPPPEDGYCAARPPQ